MTGKDLAILLLAVALIMAISASFTMKVIHCHGGPAACLPDH